MNKIYLKFFINFSGFLPRYPGTQSLLIPVDQVMEPGIAHDVLIYFVQYLPYYVSV